MAQATDTVVITRHIGAPPDVVFSYFTDRARWLQWMGTDAELNPVVGGRYRIDVTGPEHVAAGSFLAIDPPRRVVFSWGWEEAGHPVPAGSSVVEVVLEPTADGTLLRLTHRDLPADQPAGHAEGWNHYLDRLQLRAAGADPGPDDWLPAR